MNGYVEALEIEHSRVQRQAKSRSSATRVLAFMEATSLTGPAKNLIEFARRANRDPSGKTTIEIATFRRGSSTVSNGFVSACHEAGVEVHIISERFAFDLAVVPSMRRLINRCDPDIVQTHSVKSHFLMRLSQTHGQRYWIAFHHGYTRTNAKMQVYNHFDRWSLPAAHHVVTVCHSFASELEGVGVSRRQITVQHNSVIPWLPVTREESNRLRASLGIPSNAMVLLAVGRLSREKGHIDLIAAMYRLRAQNAERDVRLVIVGDGPERTRIQKAAEQSMPLGCVILAGHQPELSGYYTIADVMVLPSHTEGSPNALLEAMAAGIPVVATAVGGIPEIASNEHSALLVEKENTAALACAIERLLEDKGLRERIGNAARIAVSAYGPEAYCNSMLSLYDRLIR